MKKIKKKYYAITASIIVLIIIVVAVFALKKDNWEESYATDDSNPFGLEIFDQELNLILKNKKITKLNSYDYFVNSIYDTLPSKTLLYLNTEFYYDDFEEILESLKNHEVFIISTQPFNFIEDTLFTSKKINHIPNLKQKDSLIFKNPDLKPFNTSFIYKFSYEKINLNGYQSETLSTLNNNETFKRIKINNNYLYICYTPQVFSNHYLKNNSLAYPSAVLSYIKYDEVIVYNNSYKSTNEQVDYEQEDTSILYFILNNKKLKIALYLFLFGSICFTLFKTKRVQRVIPLLPKNKNRSLEFIKTIANLYYNTGNNLGIIHKMNQQFLYRIEKKYHLKTNVLDEHFIIMLTKYSNQDKEFVTQVINKLKYYNATHFNPTQQEVSQHYINLKKIS